MRFGENSEIVFLSQGKRPNETNQETIKKMKHSKQIQIIKESLNDGKRVFMTPNKAYEVIRDRVGQYLVKCHINDHFVGLHGMKNTDCENEINYLCQDDGNPHPITIESKENDLVFVETIKLEKLARYS